MARLFKTLPPKVVVGGAVAAVAAIVAVALMGARHNRPMQTQATTSASAILAEEAHR